MSFILSRNGKVVVQDTRLARESCTQCCGLAASEGYYAATPCSNVCDPSIAPPVLYIPASIAYNSIFATLVGCYQIDFSVLYWDCVFRGPPPSFGVGRPPYLCAPLDFYRPGRRYPLNRPPQTGSWFQNCTDCFNYLYRQQDGSGPACPGNNTILSIGECQGCERLAVADSFPPFEGTVVERGAGMILVLWDQLKQVLSSAIADGSGCKAVLGRESNDQYGKCLSVDLRYPNSAFFIWNGTTELNTLTQVFDSCCACHAETTAIDAIECVPYGESFVILTRPRCAPGVRPDWSLAYRCPPQVPIGKPCCCPGTPCHRRLRMRARRVDTQISTGITTTQVWAGWAPGTIRVRAKYHGSDHWEPLPDVIFPEHPACDPMALFQLLGRAGECGDDGFEVELAQGDCWRASYIERRTSGDNHTRIEYYAAFDTLGDGFPFLPELNGVPNQIQSTAGLLAVPVLGVPNNPTECQGIPKLRIRHPNDPGPDVFEEDVVDGDVEGSWRVCQDGCSGGGDPFPQPGEPGGPFGPPGLIVGRGGGCGSCGADGGL